MKYMKLGSKPDTFCTEDGVRTLLSDEPGDLLVQINSTRYRLHKILLLPKCGLLQSLCSAAGDAPPPVQLVNASGGEEGFELCAKFAYDIAINLSAHNIVAAVCSARFLKMTEAVARGNFAMKLETFFDACILRGWKDCILTLQTTTQFVDCSETSGIVHRCIEAIVQKILAHPSKVSWPYTYTRPGFSGSKSRSPPRDWWTEDISKLELEHFRSVISAVRSHDEIPPSLVGEALHVYACKHILSPDLETSDESLPRRRRLLESVVAMIPADLDSVSEGFLMKLLRAAAALGASPPTTAELARRSGHRLPEAAPPDLLFLSSDNSKTYNVELVELLLENFLRQFRGSAPPPDSAVSMRKVGKTIDSYLRIIAGAAATPAAKFAGLAAALPELARPIHDDLYFAVDTFLTEHQELSKEEKKLLCRIIDCRKLSPEARSHAITNDRLPLRTIVQVLFAEQERAASASRVSPRRCTAAGATANTAAEA